MNTDKPANIVKLHGYYFYTNNADKFIGIITFPVRGQGFVTAENVRITRDNAHLYGKSLAAARSEAYRVTGYSKLQK